MRREARIPLEARIDMDLRSDRDGGRQIDIASGQRVVHTYDFPISSERQFQFEPDVNELEAATRRQVTYTGLRCVHK